jgi:hypothetical protein
LQDKWVPATCEKLELKIKIINRKKAQLLAAESVVELFVV